MKMIESFDPSSAPSGTIDHKVSNPCGGIYLFNESNVWLQLRLPGGHQVGLPAWWSRFYRLSEVLESIQWSELATISTVSAPLSQVYGEAYESSELKGRNFYDGPIPRNPYIGNQVSSNVSTNQVINDGNLAPMAVAEATQNGNTGGSNLYVGNDGSFYFAQWISSVYKKYFSGVPGASPVIVLGANTILQGLDNSGANQCNIFGVDGAGNTFIQNHLSNKQTMVYSSGGALLVTIDDSGNIFASGNNSNKLSNITFMPTPYLFNNNGSLSSGAAVDQTVTGGSTGVPSGAIAVIIQAFFTSTSVGAFLQFSKQGSAVTNTSDAPFIITQVASHIAGGMAIVPVNTTNGKITASAHQGNLTGINSSVYGYII